MTFVLGRRKVYNNTVVRWNATGTNLPYTSLMKQHHDVLKESIRSAFDDDGVDFIGELIKTGVIDEQERDELDVEPTPNKKADKLLTMMCQPNKAIGHFELMLDALDACGQRRLTDIIRQALGTFVYI